MRSDRPWAEDVAARIADWSGRLPPHDREAYNLVSVRAVSGDEVEVLYRPAISGHLCGVKTTRINPLSPAYYPYDTDSSGAPDPRDYAQVIATVLLPEPHPDSDFAEDPSDPRGIRWLIARD